MTDISSPAACTLPGEAYSERMEWIAALNRRALRAHSTEGNRLSLTYVLAAAPQPCACT